MNSEFAKALPFPLVIWDVDRDSLKNTRISFANCLAEGHLVPSVESLGRSSLIGVSWSDLVPPDEERAEAKMMSRVAHLRALTTGEYQVSDSVWGGHAWKAYTIPFNGGKDRIADLLVDVTELHQLMSSFKRTNEDLERFAYSASHDLSEPLRMVSGWVNVIFEELEELEETEHSETMVTAKGYILEGVSRMRRLISDLLNFSRVGRSLLCEFTPLSNPLLEALENLVVLKDETGAKITVDTLPTVYCDPRMMVIVFSNLIANAIKFRISGTTPEIHVGCKFDDKSYSIYVADNGIGIDPKYQEQVFEVFSRLYAREDYEGTGIGLALVRRIIHAHGGEVLIHSEGSNKGTLVEFTLPVRMEGEVGHA